METIHLFQNLWKRTVNFVNHLLFLSYAFISIIILYPQQIIINIILLIIRLNKYGASMLFSELDKKFLITFDFELLSWKIIYLYFIKIYI